MLSIPLHAQEIVSGAVHLIKGWLLAGDASNLENQVRSETQSRWVPQLSFSKGRRLDPGHTMSRFGDPGITYSFKGKEKPMFAMPSSLVKLQKMVYSELLWRPNCCVVNSYAPGSGLYPHRDGKYIPQLGTNPVIVAVSFGATRTFLLHPWDHQANKRCKTGVISLALGHGDLLIMHGNCDADFQHSIPEEPGVVGERVSLTFRQHLVV